MCGFLDNDTFYRPRPALGTEVMWCDVCVTEKNDVDAQNISSDGSINVTIYTVYSHTSVDWESVTLSVSVPILFGTEKKTVKKVIAIGLLNCTIFLFTPSTTEIF